MFKKSYVLLKNIDGTWFAKKNNDAYLDNLALIFEESSGFSNSLIEHMRDPNSRGFAGNKVRVYFENNNIKIMFSYDDDPEKYAFIIDRDLLIKIIRAWQKLVKQEPKEITIYQDGDEYTLEGVLENGEKITHIVS